MLLQILSEHWGYSCQTAGPSPANNCSILTVRMVKGETNVFLWHLASCNPRRITMALGESHLIQPIFGCWNLGKAAPVPATHLQIRDTKIRSREQQCGHVQKCGSQKKGRGRGRERGREVETQVQPFDLLGHPILGQDRTQGIMRQGPGRCDGGRCYQSAPSSMSSPSSIANLHSSAGTPQFSRVRPVGNIIVASRPSYLQV